MLASGRKHPRRRLIAIGAAVLAVLAAAGFWLTSGSGGSAVTYTTQPVTSGDLTVNVVATGTVQPTNQVSISSELSGTVRTVLVDYNETVKQGQVLAQLDTDKLNANLALAKATLAARQADVLQAQATVDQTAAVLARTTDLAGRGVSASQTLETAQADSDRAKAALASAKANQQIAEANVSIAETDLSKSEIKSPIDGVVLSRAVDPGQIVASSLSAPVLFTLAEDLSEMQLQVGIDEADMGKVKQGDTATFTVEAFPGKKFPATISEIRYSPATVEGVVTYKAVLTVDNAELLLRPGHDRDGRDHRRDGQGRDPRSQRRAALRPAGDDHDVAARGWPPRSAHAGAAEPAAANGNRCRRHAPPLRAARRRAGGGVGQGRRLRRHAYGGDR